MHRLSSHVTLLEFAGLPELRCICPAIAAICVIDELLCLRLAIAFCALMNCSISAPLLLLCFDVLLRMCPATTTCVWMHPSICYCYCYLCMDVPLCLCPATTTCVWMYRSVYALLLLLHLGIPLCLHSATATCALMYCSICASLLIIKYWHTASSALLLLFACLTCQPHSNFEQDGQLIWKYNAGSSSIGCDTCYHSHFEWMDLCSAMLPQFPL
jgi:hypothetical protein